MVRKTQYLKTFGFILMIILFFSINNNAQSVTDSTLLKACEETANALKTEQIKNAGLVSENKLQIQLVELGKEKIKFVEEKADYYKKAFEASEKVDTNSTMIINNLRIEVASYKDELSRLRVENEKLRGSRNFRTLVGFGVGLGTGFVINK